MVILEFYTAAHEMLTKRGRTLIQTMVLENVRLPNIVKNFLIPADALRRLLGKATCEIVEDIQPMLNNHESKLRYVHVIPVVSDMVAVATWLDRSKLQQQNDYQAKLMDIRSNEACEFLLEDTKFVEWYQAPDSQQLAVIGEMGSGKTVAMSFIANELR